MAVSKVYQREIVEVPFNMPDGRILTHMVLVISREALQEYEDGMFYGVLISSKNHIPELTLEIKPEWLSKPLSKKSYFITHLIQQFNVDEVLNSYNMFLKRNYFEGVIDTITQNIMGGRLETSNLIKYRVLNRIKQLFSQQETANFNTREQAVKGSMSI